MMQRELQKQRKNIIRPTTFMLKAVWIWRISKCFWRLFEAAAGRAVVLLLKHFESRYSTVEDIFDMFECFIFGNKGGQYLGNTELWDSPLQNLHQGNLVSIQRITIIWVERKATLPHIQIVCDTDVSKILKLAHTRWLSQSQSHF